MADIKQNAQALMDEVKREHPTLSDYALAVFAAQRAIERHEAFRQKVSDAVEMALKSYPPTFLQEHLHQFIIPAPKPDPLVAAMKKMGWYLSESFLTDAENFRAALDALGFEIREKGQ
jgi:hypothetical protein